MAVTIANIEAIALRIPYTFWAMPSLFAGKPHVTMDSTYVRVTASNGVVGWGEAFFGGTEMNLAALKQYVAPLAIDADVEDRSLPSRIEFTLQNLGRAGSILHAVSALDIALWDIRGKLAGSPVHALLGGKRRERIGVYASLLTYRNVSEDIGRNVTRALERGYREIKLHEKTAPAVAAARAAAGADVPIMVDTNCALASETADSVIKAMKSSNPTWIEEPIWPPEDYASLAALRQSTGVALASGENATGSHAFRHMIAATAVDYVQPSVVKIGGISKLWEIAVHAEANGVICVPHSPYFGPGYLATIHVLAAKAHESSLERFFCDLDMTPFAASVPVENGFVAVPDRPGLGADPDPDLLEAYQVR